MKSFGSGFSSKFRTFAAILGFMGVMGTSVGNYNVANAVTCKRHDSRIMCQFDDDEKKQLGVSALIYNRSTQEISDVLSETGKPISGDCQDAITAKDYALRKMVGRSIPLAGVAAPILPLEPITPTSGSPLPALTSPTPATNTAITAMPASATALTASSVYDEFDIDKETAMEWAKEARNYAKQRLSKLIKLVALEKYDAASDSYIIGMIGKNAGNLDALGSLGKDENNPSVKQLIRGLENASSYVGALVNTSTFAVGKHSPEKETIMKKFMAKHINETFFASAEKAEPDDFKIEWNDAEQRLNAIYVTDNSLKTELNNLRNTAYSSQKATMLTDTVGNRGIIVANNGRLLWQNLPNIDLRLPVILANTSSDILKEYAKNTPNNDLKNVINTSVEAVKKEQTLGSLRWRIARSSSGYTTIDDTDFEKSAKYQDAYTAKIPLSFGKKGQKIEFSSTENDDAYTIDMLVVGKFTEGILSPKRGFHPTITLLDGQDYAVQLEDGKKSKVYIFTAKVEKEKKAAPAAQPATPPPPSLTVTDDEIKKDKTLNVIKASTYPSFRLTLLGGLNPVDRTNYSLMAGKPANFNADANTGELLNNTVFGGDLEFTVPEDGKVHFNMGIGYALKGISGKTEGGLTKPNSSEISSEISQNYNISNHDVTADMRLLIDLVEAKIYNDNTAGRMTLAVPSFSYHLNYASQENDGITAVAGGNHAFLGGIEFAHAKSQIDREFDWAYKIKILGGYNKSDMISTANFDGPVLKPGIEGRIMFKDVIRLGLKSYFQYADLSGQETKTPGGAIIPLAEKSLTVAGELDLMFHAGKGFYVGPYLSGFYSDAETLKGAEKLTQDTAYCIGGGLKVEFNLPEYQTITTTSTR